MRILDIKKEIIGTQYFELETEFIYELLKIDYTYNGQFSLHRDGRKRFGDVTCSFVYAKKNFVKLQDFLERNTYTISVILIQLQNLNTKLFSKEILPLLV